MYKRQGAGLGDHEEDRHDDEQAGQAAEDRLPAGLLLVLVAGLRAGREVALQELDAAPVARDEDRADEAEEDDDDRERRLIQGSPRLKRSRAR